MSTISQLSAATNPATGSISRNDAPVVGSAADEAGAKIAKNFDEFMLLLTTQLQNQDPTEPLDTNQFTQQLATLSSVEQSVQTNKNLEKLVNLTGNNQVGAAVSFIGKSVEAPGTVATLKNGRATFAADIPAGTASVTMGIVDSAGRPVYSATGKASAGHQNFSWDGTRSFGGAGTAADGNYTFGIVARDASGKILDTKTYSTGKVSGVSMVDGDVTLTLESGQTVAMQEVSSIREAPVAAATATN